MKTIPLFKSILCGLFVAIVALAMPKAGYATAWVTTTAGNAATLANWTNGSTAPSSFITPGDTWTIAHNMTLAVGATWELGSASSAPVTLNISSGGSLTQSGTITAGVVKVHGMVNVNGGAFRYSSTSGTQNVIIDGDLIINSGEFTSSGTSVTRNMIIGGNFTMNGGLFLNSGNGPDQNISIGGDFALNGGVIRFSATGALLKFDVAGNTSLVGDSINASGNSPRITINTTNMSISGGFYKAQGNGPNFDINATGNCTITGGWAEVQATVGGVNIVTYGNFNMSGGLLQGGTGNTAWVKAKIYGDCSITGPSSFNNLSAHGINEIHLAKPPASGIMNVLNTSYGTILKTTSYVDTGCLVQLVGNYNSGGSTSGVVVNGTLFCPDTRQVNGLGTFRVNGVGSLYVANAGGINGNITTAGTKTLSPVAKYFYNGTVPQVTGTYLPGTLNAGSVITVNNPSGVTLSQNTTTQGTVSLVNGILHTSTYTLTTNGAPGSITGAGATRYIDGALNKSTLGLTSIFYEVGNISYKPATLSLSAVGTTSQYISVRCVNGAHSAIGTSGVLATNMLNDYWSIGTTMPASTTTVGLSVAYNSGDIIGGSNLSFSAQKYNSAWLGASLPATNTSSPYTSALVSDVPMTALAGAWVFGNTCGTPITGSTNICVPTGTTTLANATPGGAWGSSNPAVATVSGSGLVTGVATGTTVIFYTTSLCSVSTIVAVGTTPISGASHVCLTSSTALTNATPGGVWSSSAPSVASVSSSGVVSGVAAGTAVISYTVGSCAPATHVVSVSGVAPITGTPLLYMTGTAPFSCATPGGSWSSSISTVASVDAAGVVTAIAPGTTTISYTVGTCSQVYPVEVMFNYQIVADSVRQPSDTACNTPKFYVKANGYSPLLRLKTWYGDGYKDSIALTSIGTAAYVNASHAYACAGVHTVKQVLYYNNYRMDSIMFTYHHSGCNNLRVCFYFDNNGDGIKAASEPMNVVPINVKIDSAGVPLDTMSATAGLNYKVYGTPGTVYSFSVLPGSNLSVSGPSSGVLNKTIGGSATYTSDFMGLQCTGACADFNINAVVPISAANRMDAKIYVRNDHCTPANTAVSFNYYTGYTSIVYNSPLPATTAPGTITWNLSGLSFATGVSTISLRLAATPVATVGTFITERAKAEPMVVDCDTTDNEVVINDTVTGPYDPNMVDVAPFGCFQPTDTQLQYTVHFENMGNDTAHNIYVMDTMSDHVDLSTMKILMTSAQMEVTTFTAGPYNIARFDFPDIRLPDSSHHGLSDGSVIFTIKLKPGLPMGTVVTNHAGIYFDYMDVVMTNTAATTKGCPSTTQVASVPLNQLELYPNPADGMLNIKAPATLHGIEISDMLGRTVYSGTHTAASATVDVSRFVPGVYMVRVNGYEVKRFVKK